MSDVIFKKPDGTFVKVDSSEAAQAQELGYEPSSEAQVKASRQPGRALFEGAARGVTLGVSDPFAVAFGVPRQELKLRKQENPVAAGVGEFAGVVGPAIATGGISGLAGGGIRGAALETGIYGMGSMISESALENRPLTAEHLASGLVSSALAGGGVAAGLGLVGKGASMVTSKFGGQGLKAALNEAALTIEGRALVEGASGTVKKLKERGGSVRDVVEYAKDKGIPVAFTAEALESAQKALRVTGDSTAELMKKVDSFNPLSVDKNRSILVDKVIKVTRDSFKGDIAAEPHVEKFIAEKLEPLIGRTDLSYPQLYKLQSQLRKDVASVAENDLKKDVYDSGRKALRNIIFADAEAVNPGVQAQLHRLQKDFATGEFLKKSIENRMAKLEATGGVPGIGVMDVLRGGGLGGSIGAAVGGPVGAPLGALAGAYANKLMRERGGSMAASALRSVADSQILNGVSKGLAGHLGKVLSVAPEVLGAYRYPLAVAAAKGADELLAEHVRQASAPTGHDYLARVALGVESPSEVDSAGARLAMLNSVQEAAVARDIEMNKAVDGIFGSAPGRKSSLGKPLSLKEFGTVSNSLKEALRSPEKVFEQVPAELRAGAPSTSAEASAGVLRALQYLDSKLPKSPHSGLPESIAPKWEPSAAELDRFNRYKEAVESPAKALKNMAQGYMAPEQVEAIKAVYPAIYEELRQKLSDRLMQTHKPLNYQQKTAIMSILGPGAVGMSPQQVQILQQSFQQASGQQQGGGMKRPDGRQSVDQEKNQQTQAQRLEAR